jgi:hypothetical protein
VTEKSLDQYDEYDECKKTAALFLKHSNVEYNVINKYFLRVLLEQTPFQNNKIKYCQSVLSNDKNVIFYRLMMEQQYDEFKPFVINMNGTDVFIQVINKFNKIYYLLF